MKYTVLGRSGISVSRISMGTHHLNDPADMDKHVQNFLYAYKKGINFFETSVTYGEGYSELILGDAVKEIKRDGEGQRRGTDKTYRDLRAYEKSGTRTDRKRVSL